MSLVSYFVDTYPLDKRLEIIKTKFSYLKNHKKIILSEKDFIEGISVLSSTDFDIFLKEFAQCLNIQISQDVSYVLQFCGFYLKSWETSDKDHTKTLNIDLPKENISDTIVRKDQSLLKPTKK